MGYARGLLLEAKKSSLIFLNTRSQTKRWYQELLKLKPEWAGVMAIHHGSINKKTRVFIENQLRLGLMKVVVCTSSLDLGVDFSPVEQVIQVGSPKGIARFLQRAGRSNHKPHQKSDVILFPTHAFELFEYEALLLALKNEVIEKKRVLRKPYDVLLQHIVTIALSTGFNDVELFNEVTQSETYKTLGQDEWRAMLNFLHFGADVLNAYPEYHKLAFKDGRYLVESRQIAMRHRMNIGTIVADSLVPVYFQRGKHIADVEERFIAKLKKGDIFFLAGRHLEFIRLHDMKAQVKLARKKPRIIPRWVGGKMPLSSELGEQLKILFGLIQSNAHDTRSSLQNILSLQRNISNIPKPCELLVETTKTREGYHLFIFPCLGRQNHEMIATIMAYRMAQFEPCSLSISINDYGFEIFSPTNPNISESKLQSLWTSKHIVEDMLASINETELLKRQFREIARISGLIFQGYPGAQKSMRQIQSSSGLIFEVFMRHAPNNILLKQAREEVLHQVFDLDKCEQIFKSLGQQKILLNHCDTLTPFSFPLWVELQKVELSSEACDVRVERMLQKLKKIYEH